MKDAQYEWICNRFSEVLNRLPKGDSEKLAEENRMLRDVLVLARQFVSHHPGCNSMDSHNVTEHCTCGLIEALRVLDRAVRRLPPSPKEPDDLPVFPVFTIGTCEDCGHLQPSGTFTRQAHDKDTGPFRVVYSNEAGRTIFVDASDIRMARAAACGYQDPKILVLEGLEVASPPSPPSPVLFEVIGAYLLPPHNSKIVTADMLADTVVAMETASLTSEVCVRTGKWIVSADDKEEPIWAPLCPPKSPPVESERKYRTHMFECEAEKAAFLKGLKIGAYGTVHSYESIGEWAVSVLSSNPLDP